MHTDAERKYTAKAARVRCASREDETSLLDCADPCRGNKPLRRRTGRAASRGGIICHRD